jgi:3-oxoacyl-[acyl-carrier protein] reductase
MDFTGKYVLVTGASQGIGLAIVNKFAELGANIILVSRNIYQLNSIRDELKSKYQKQEFFTVSCDLSVLENIPNIFAELNNNNIISLDILVNNAGVMIDSMLQQQKVNDMIIMFNTNIMATILVCQASLRFFLKKRKGNIINVSSIIGENGAIGQSVYSATKASVLGFTKSLSKELARLNINVNSISPGYIDTNMTQKYNQELKDSIINNIGFRRAGTAEDVAEAVVFLASEKSSYITGHNIQINGGMII